MDERPINLGLKRPKRCENGEKPGQIVLNRAKSRAETSRREAPLRSQRAGPRQPALAPIGGHHRCALPLAGGRETYMAYTITI